MPRRIEWENLLIPLVLSGVMSLGKGWNSPGGLAVVAGFLYMLVFLKSVGEAKCSWGLLFSTILVDAGVYMLMASGAGEWRALEVVALLSVWAIFAAGRDAERNVRRRRRHRR